MKIAIISDTHDNIPNTRKATEWIVKNGIKTIIHCGDIFKPETVREILKYFEGKLYLIFSPADASFSKIPEDSFEKFRNVKIFNEFGEIKISGKNIAFCHFPEIAKELADSGMYNLVFYGHTHKPWEETLRRFAPQGKLLRHGSGQGTRMVNPGNLAGIFYKATFAVYDTKTDKLELKILERL